MIEIRELSFNDENQAIVVILQGNVLGARFQPLGDNCRILAVGEEYDGDIFVLVLDDGDGPGNCDPVGIPGGE